MALILADIEVNYAETNLDQTKARYPADLMADLAAKQFKNEP